MTYIQNAQEKEKIERKSAKKNRVKRRKTVNKIKSKFFITR